MHFFKGKTTPVPALVPVKSPNFRPMESENGVDREGRNLLSRFPCRATLKLFARSCAGRTIGHPATKALAGPLFALGMKFDCLGMNNDWFGEYAAYVAAGSATLWLVSTAVSLYNKPPYESCVKHLAQSVGYGVAGSALIPAQLVTWLCCRESLREFDVDAIRKQLSAEKSLFLDDSDVESRAPSFTEPSGEHDDDLAVPFARSFHKDLKYQDRKMP